VDARRTVLGKSATLRGRRDTRALWRLDLGGFLGLATRELITAFIGVQSIPSWGGASWLWCLAWIMVSTAPSWFIRLPWYGQDQEGRVVRRRMQPSLILHESH